MKIQKLSKEYYSVFYKGEYYYGTLLEALNSALAELFIGKPIRDIVGSHIGNYPPGYDNEGTNIGRDW